MPPKPPLRLGIIGCGNVLDAYMPVCEKLQARGLAEVVLACGRPAQRERALQAWGIPRFTTEAREVLEAPDVDAVLVLTSMKKHGALARAALLAGKHVLVEKPLATSLDEARELLQLASKGPGLLVCAPFTLLSPTFQTIARRLRQGDIGRPCLARARYGWAGPEWSEWFYKADGGCLFDLGVYCLTSLTGLLGPARRVTAMTGVAIPERPVNGRPVRVEAEDNAQVLLDFGQSLFAVVTTGFTIQQYRSPALEVYGTEGVIQMLGDDWDPDGYELWQNSVGAWQVFKETAPEWPWTDGLNHLVECVGQACRPLVTPEHAFHVLEIMLKAKQSSQEGRALALESTFEPVSFPEVASREAPHLAHDRSRERGATQAAAGPDASR